MRVPTTLLQEKELTLSAAFTVRQHDLCHLVQLPLQTGGSAVPRYVVFQHLHKRLNGLDGRPEVACEGVGVDVAMSLSRDVGNHFAPGFVLQKARLSCVRRNSPSGLEGKPSGQTAVPDSDHE